MNHAAIQPVICQMSAGGRKRQRKRRKRHSLFALFAFSFGKLET
jgi:hypothetical protein